MKKASPVVVSPRRRTKHMDDVSPIIQLWLLRILVPLGGQQQFVNFHWFDSNRLARAVGLDAWIDDGDGTIIPRLVLADLPRRPGGHGRSPAVRPR